MQSERPFHSWHNRRTFAQLQPYVIFAYFNHPYHPFMSYNGTYENKRMISNVSICEILEEYKRTNTKLFTRNYADSSAECAAQFFARWVRYFIVIGNKRLVSEWPPTSFSIRGLRLIYEPFHYFVTNLSVDVTAICSSRNHHENLVWSSFRITTSSRDINSLSIRSSLWWRNATEPNWIVSVAGLPGAHFLIFLRWRRRRRKLIVSEERGGCLKTLIWQQRRTPYPRFCSGL